MTFTLELTPAETRRIEGARERGVDIAALVRGLIMALPEPQAQTAPEEQERQRIEAIDAVVGKYAHLGVSVDDLHRERQADKEREERLTRGYEP